MTNLVYLIGSLVSFSIGISTLKQVIKKPPSKEDANALAFRGYIWGTAGLILGVVLLYKFIINRV